MGHPRCFGTSAIYTLLAQRFLCPFKAKRYLKVDNRSLYLYPNHVPRSKEDIHLGRQQTMSSQLFYQHISVQPLFAFYLNVTVT